jgi:hypothetical protein
MIRIHFSPYDPRRRTILLANACGFGREPADMELAHRRELHEIAPSLWESSDAGSAQLFVYTHSYDLSRPDVVQEATALEDLAKQAGRPCLFFDPTDNCTPYAPKYAIAYRFSMFHEPQTYHCRAEPPACDDSILLADWRSDTGPRPKRAKPVVGFCGYISAGWKQWLRTLRGESQKIAGHRIRRAAIAALKGSPRVDTNFLVRSSFQGGALLAKHDPQRLRQIKREYIDNILDSDYTLCARGAGNFSIRFCETLSAGRIPLLINTGCSLPFEKSIDWRRHCVIVDEADLNQVGDRLSAFHDALSPDAFKSLQQANRKLWLETLSPVEFLRHIVAEITANAS